MTATQDRLTGLKACLAVICIFFIATALRYEQHPAYFYDDETIAVNVIRFMEEHSSLDTNWNNADWDGTWTPFMFDYDQYNFSSWISCQYYLKQLTEKIYKTEPLLLYRYFTLVFHLLTLALILFAAWRWMGTPGTLLSGAFFAVTPMFMIDAHYARPETFLTLITTLAIFVHIEQEKARIRNPWLDVAAGFLWGMAVTCKISMIPMAFVFFVRRLWNARSNRMIFSWIMGGVFAALLFAPYLFINYNYIISGAKALFGQYMSSDSQNVKPFILAKYLLYFVGPVSITAIIYSCYSQDKVLRITSQLLLLISFFYLVFFSLATFINESNLSHMAGAWSWMFAIGFIAFARRISNLHHQNPLKTSLIIIALLPSIVISAIINTQVFNDAGAVQASIRAYEKGLMQEYAAPIIIPVESATADMLENAQLPENVLLRVAMTECYDYKKTIGWLDKQSSLKKIDQLTLPLHFLPCSNKIDTIHFPPGYAYYVSVNAAHAAGKMR